MAEEKPLIPPPPEKLLPPPDWFTEFFLAPLTRILPPPLNCATEVEKVDWKERLETYRGRPVVEGLISSGIGPAITKKSWLTDAVVDRAQWVIDNYVPTC